MDSKIRVAIGWTDIKKREEAVKALIEAEITERETMARLDEAKQIRTWVEEWQPDNIDIINALNSGMFERTEKLNETRILTLKQGTEANKKSGDEDG